MISDLLNISTTNAERCCFYAKKNDYLKAAIIKLFMVTMDHMMVLVETNAELKEESEYWTIIR